jgi:hypothetical protein
MSDQLHLQALQSLTVAVNKIVETLGGSFVIPLGPARGGTGIANNAASTITITGAYATALTVTNTTVLTLPTTGTLATLAGSEALTNKSYNGLTVTSTTGTFTLTNGKTFSVAKALTLDGTDSTTMTFPTTSASIARTDAGQTFTGASTITSWIANTVDARGVWTAGATWTLPALTLGGTVSGGGQQLNNIIIGTTTPLAGSFTTLSASGAAAVGSFSKGAPVTKTLDFSLAATENWVINNRAATNTVTLPAASSWNGRVVTMSTIQAQTVVSAASDVVPLVGGAAGTAILAGTAGKWATLVSDGTNWVIMAGN